MSDRLHSVTDFRELLRESAGDAPYDYAGIFSDQGFFARRLSKRKLRLLKRVDHVVRPMLREGERVQFVTWATAVSFWEAYFLGWALQLMNRRALLVTNERILLVQINSRDRPRELRSQIRYAAIRKLSLTVLGNVKITFRGGPTKVFSQVPRRDRRFLKELVNEVAAGLGDVPADADTMEELCPHCFEPAEPADRACPACQRGFKSPTKAGLLSLLFPGFGDLYIGHRGLATLEIFGGVVFWLIVLLLAFDVTIGAVESVILAVMGFLFVHGADAVVTRFIAGKGVRAEHGPPLGAPRLFAAALPLVALVAVSGMAVNGKTGLAPSPLIVAGSELTPKQRLALQRAGFAEPNDEIVYFYSAGPGTILRDGNFFTTDRIVSYARDTESVFHEEAPLADVAYLYAVPAVGPGGNTHVYVMPRDGEMFYLIVSSTDGRDTLFLAALVERWRAAHQRQPAGGFWFDGGSGSSVDDALVVHGANATQVRQAERWFLQQWVGIEGEDWQFRNREMLTSRGRIVSRVTIETGDGESEQYHFDVTEAVGVLRRS